ncbi:hypothetical protein GR268_42760 [Rhizobium leguminosarum]|nr:hypothetical protein [Rhizobium leguminosarum]
MSITEEPITSVETTMRNNTLQPTITPLIDQELTAQGGHAVTFYQEAGELKADVKMNAPQGFSKTYDGLGVYRARGRAI